MDLLSTFLVVGGRIIVMKIFFAIIGSFLFLFSNFVYADSLNLNDKKSETPIGVNCRTCDRMDCQQRAFPPLHKKFDIDLNKRGISVYVAD